MRRVAIAAAIAVLVLVPGTASAASLEQSYRQLAPRADALRVAPLRAQTDGSAVYEDATGDAGTGPDMTAATVQNDDSRVLTFKIDIPNRPSPTSGFALIIFLNSDLNPATGDLEAGGIDHVLIATHDGVGLGRWTGTTMDFSADSSLTGSYGSGPTFTINAADIGNPDLFSFWIGVTDNFDDPNNFDAMPEVGQSIYAMEITPVITGLDIPRGTLVAHAGKTLSLLPIGLRLDTDEVVVPDTRECSATLGSKTLRALEGGCRWKMPKAARGKRVKLQVTLGYKGAETSQTFSVRVIK